MKQESPQHMQPVPSTDANRAPFNQDESALAAPIIPSVPPESDRSAWALKDPEPPVTSTSLVAKRPEVPQTSAEPRPNKDIAPSTPAERPPRRKGNRAVAGLLALGLAATATVISSRGNSHEDQTASVNNEPGVTADQAPTTLGATATTQEAGRTSTTVTSVALSPRNEAPSAKVTVKPAEAGKPASANSSPSTVKTNESVAPEKRLLSSQELQKIIAATNYQGLEGHRFEIEDEFTTKAARYVVINLDGTKSVVPLSELKADIAQAEADAAARPTFTSRVQLGPGEARDITFQAGPAKLTSEGTDTRYIIYTDSELDSLTAPVAGFPDASTISRPYKNLNVSLIKNQPGKKTDGFASNSFNTGVEVRQTTTSFDLSAASEQELDEDTPDMSYISGSSDYLQRKMALTNIGREIYTNSLSYAQESREAGVSYEQYKEKAKAIPLRAYSDADVYYFAVPAAQYNSLG